MFYILVEKLLDSLWECGHAMPLSQAVESTVTREAKDIRLFFTEASMGERRHQGTEG
jgi:hypothetical protein